MGKTQKKYKIKEVTCTAEACNTKFDVVISPIETLVTEDTGVSKTASATGLKEISHYIVVTCPQDKTHSQRVYIDSN